MRRAALRQIGKGFPLRNHQRLDRQRRASFRRHQHNLRRHRKATGRPMGEAQVG